MFHPEHSYTWYPLPNASSLLTWTSYRPNKCQIIASLDIFEKESLKIEKDIFISILLLDQLQRLGF